MAGADDGCPAPTLGKRCAQAVGAAIERVRPALTAGRQLGILRHELASQFRACPALQAKAGRAGQTGRF